MRPLSAAEMKSPNRQKRKQEPRPGTKLRGIVG
jgi:hypothetical protein